MTRTGAKSTAKPLVRPSSAATTPPATDVPGLGFISTVPNLPFRKFRDARQIYIPDVKISEPPGWNLALCARINGPQNRTVKAAAFDQRLFEK